MAAERELNCSCKGDSRDSCANVRNWLTEQSVPCSGLSKEECRLILDASSIPCELNTLAGHLPSVLALSYTIVPKFWQSALGEYTSREQSADLDYRDITASLLMSVPGVPDILNSQSMTSREILSKHYAQ